MARLAGFIALAAGASSRRAPVLAFSADALIEQTGLQAGFVGLIFGGPARAAWGSTSGTTAAIGTEIES